MSAAELVFGYAVALAWSVPVLLARLTTAGVSARLGMAAWLTAMASVLASAAAAVALLAGAAVAGLPRLAAVVCRSVAGRACTPVVYRSAAFEVPLGIAALAATLAAAALRVAVRPQRAPGRAAIPGACGSGQDHRPAAAGAGRAGG